MKAPSELIYNEVLCLDRFFPGTELSIPKCTSKSIEPACANKNLTEFVKEVKLDRIQSLERFSGGQPSLQCLSRVTLLSSQRTEQSLALSQTDPGFLSCSTQ